MTLLDTNLAVPLAASALGLAVGVERGLPFPAPRRLPPDDAAYGKLLQDAMLRLRAAEARIAEQKERIEHLEALAMTDELTGLPNRRGFVEAFRRELASARRSGKGGVLAIVDLDGFKAINDVHGHLCGDHYLRQVARALADNVRAHDVVARFGGDEFAVLLTDVEAGQGAERAKALSRRFNALTCRWQMLDLPLRASFGVEAYGANDREEEVIRRADAAMYQMKKSNRVARAG
ncbi:diguanylate cyclase [Niveispirillum sp. SYP-B3756]|uniref:GGDEF domain-containing protein n=1 Tax=Niveispirillum sp. SYP-B3756 TaxID=2662178 RepID=UPI001292A175|nr:GGDEF domain-containing protein [Niveispirillum sp. SYP-B3756]MQP68674.1 diguanylate cyclase [Niveispirillum sp. SYP-B3756]